MSAVAMAIALSVPIVLMDDSEAEKVIAGIPGIRDGINIFRSVAVIRAAKAFNIIFRRTERALEKKWASKVKSPMRSENEEWI
jgi:predicted nucleic acid-binding protein